MLYSVTPGIAYNVPRWSMKLSVVIIIMDTIRVNNFSYFVRSISICGHSAGGQLCAMVLASTWFSNLPTDHKNMFQVTTV